MSVSEDYLATDAGRREVERHLAAVRAERGVTEGLLGKFTERLHPRDRGGQFATGSGGGSAPHGRTEFGAPRTSPPRVNGVTRGEAGSESDAISSKIAHAEKGLGSTRLTGNSLASAKEAIAKARAAAKAGDFKAAEEHLKMVEHLSRVMDDRAEVRKTMSRRRRKLEVRDIGEALLIEAGFAAQLHPRDRTGKWREVLGELGPVGQTKIGGTAHRGLPKSSQAPKVTIRRAGDPLYTNTEMHGHEVLPGVALVKHDRAGYRAVHIATGLPIHTSYLKGSHKAAVETTRGAIGHVDWSAPDTKSFQGSEPHRRAQQIMDHAAQRSSVNHHGYQGSETHAEDREGLADLRARGTALETGATVHSVTAERRRHAKANAAANRAQDPGRDRLLNPRPGDPAPKGLDHWAEVGKLYKVIASLVKANGVEKRKALARLREMGVAPGGPGADWMDGVAAELKKRGLLDSVVPKRKG